MNRHADRGPTWFDEVLKGSGINPARLARVDSTRRPVVERSNPWNDPDGIEEAGAVLQAARGKDPDPGQIVFVTDIDEDPIARVEAAVQLGRAAVARGIDILLVDADVRHVGLSRWLPDRDLDAEGLVDVVQYGASVSAARRPSSIDGIDVLGIGSYRPDAAGIYGDDDVRRLLAQLRLSAGLVLVVGPAQLLDQRFHPLLACADSIVLSMHLDQGLSQDLTGLLAHLDTIQVPLSGAFIWAGPDDSERFVDDALLERSRILPPITTDSPFPGRGKSDAGGSKRDEAAESAPVSAPISMGHGDPLPSPPEKDSDDGPSTVHVRTERPRPGRKQKTGSSALVRGVFVVIAVGIIGFVGWWALTWRSVEPTRPRVQPTEQQTAATTVAEPATDQVADSAAVPETVDLAAADEVPVEIVPEEEEGPADASVETSRDAEGLMAEPVESAPAVAEQVPPRTEADPFEAALRRTGTSGWGLHLFSFTDEREASADRARLERQGYSAVVREATIKGDQWYRVVVGHFSTRAEAAEYRVPAQEKFRVDWVGVVEK